MAAASSSAPAGSLFEPFDFDDLHELIALAEQGEAKDDPLAAALKLGTTETERVAAEIDGQLDRLEEDSVGDYVASFKSFQDLHKEIQDTDSVLEKMERMLGTFQSDLSSISEEIRTLQSDSLQMNMKLRNRRALQSLMSEYVSSVVVSPQLVRQICDEEINERYLGYLSELNRKLEHVKQQEMQRLPSCAQTAPELEKLRNKAIARIKDFLLAQINALKKPKTNLQIIQRSVLVPYKSFTQFLAEHHPAVGEEVKAYYVATMSALYTKQFRTYVTSLQKLEMEYTPTKADLLVTNDWQSSGGTAGRILDNLGLGRSIALKDKGNVFSLSGRDAILGELDKDPIVAAAHSHKVKYYHEQLFRSHQMLLMDTGTTEFLFLKDFFDTKGDHRLFIEVFGKTTQFFLDSLETFLSTCWDSVGLLLMIRIVEYHRQNMRRRNVSCLDSYLDALQLLLWPRLRVVLDANVLSLRKAWQQGLAVPTNTHPHLITRRYAELAASLYALSASWSVALPDTLQGPLQAMQQEIRTLLGNMASKLENPDSGLVFLVNNYDLVLTVFHERHLPAPATAAFEELLREQVQLFVENQLMRHFPELVTFVKTTETVVAGIDESGARASSSQGPPPGVDVEKMGQVVRLFAQNWKKETDRVHQYVMTSFTNFSNGMEILKQVLTQLLLYYTRLQKVIHKSFPQQPPAFSHDLVSNTTILMEIKQYSRSF